MKTALEHLGVVGRPKVTGQRGVQIWVPIAAGDLNADGQTDLVWRNSTTGRVIAWLMNGTTTASTATLWSGDPTWVPIAAGVGGGVGAVIGLMRSR